MVNNAQTCAGIGWLEALKLMSPRYFTSNGHKYVDRVETFMIFIQNFCCTFHQFTLQV